MDNALNPALILPCLACGQKNVKLESQWLEGRKDPVWRACCACGQASRKWSVSQGAAMRAWNRDLAQPQDPLFTDPV